MRPGQILRIFAVLFLTLVTARVAGAKVLLSERFEGKTGALRHGGQIVELPTGGKGWRSPVGGHSGDNPHYVEYDTKALFVDAARGTIEFRVNRGESYFSEAIFGLADHRGDRLFAFRFDWGGLLPPGQPNIYYYAPPESRLWYSMVGKPPVAMRYLPLGRPVERGQWVHVAITWGAPGENAIYVDGKRLPIVTKEPFGLPSLISRSKKLYVGASPVNLALQPGGGVYNMTTSVIKDFRIHDDVVPGGTPDAPLPRIVSLSDDTFKAAGISGKLVAGDKVHVEMKALPGGNASFDMGKALGLPMEEIPPTEGGPGIPAVDNGTYRGIYAVRPGDDFENGRIVGHFVSSDNVAADNVESASKWTIDTKPIVTFKVDRKDLPADSSTKSRVKLVAKDANGNAVTGRHYKLTLATTDEYTGTVGAGDFGKEVGASVETRWRGETDSWGEVEFDYTAGFAAKTVILSAKDLDSGGVSVDYLTAYKEASIDIALTPPISRAAARRGVQYILKVEASRTELTADGRSRSVIRATLSDPNGKAVAGDPVAFTLSSANGTLRTIAGTTDSSGVATAEYVAGKKIGIVVVTATATLRNVSGNVSIILLADAPAKVYLKARPATLPADGMSRSDLDVKVTDINDNPNKDTKVEFRIARGGGKLEYPDRVTDRFGDVANRYTAGATPGIATIAATVRSKVPTDAELAKAKNVLFAPYSPDGDQIRVEKWLKKKGEPFAKGDPLLEYSVGRGSAVHVLTAPFDGTLGEILVEYWDTAEVGQTLALLAPSAR